MIIYFILLIFIFIYIQYYYNNVNNISKIKLNENKDIKIKDYKLNKNKNKININDKFNIKEYDYVNNNIIIHNKFKNELLENLEIKNKLNQIQKEKNDNYKKEINQKINNNSEILLINNLNDLISNILNDIKLFKLQLRLDIQNLITDMKLNPFSNLKKNKLHTNIKLEINKIINDINYYNEVINSNKYPNQKGFNNFEYKKLLNIYIKALNKKLKLFYKKQKIYNKILN